jgi:uncharacterized protein YaiI (UPF0178 family)
VRLTRGIGLLGCAEHRTRSRAKTPESREILGPRECAPGHGGPTLSIAIFVDGDACPVKDEIYVVATRHGLPVALVANATMYVPEGLGVQLIVVEEGPDAADDWIAEHVEAHDVVVTADVPLAARCLARGALVLGNDGREFTREGIGDALATRALKSDLRGAGVQTRGPRALTAKDRSRFAERLDALVNRSLRG